MDVEQFKEIIDTYYHAIIPIDFLNIHKIRHLKADKIFIALEKEEINKFPLSLDFIKELEKRGLRRIYVEADFSLKAQPTTYIIFIFE